MQLAESADWAVNGPGNRREFDGNRRAMGREFDGNGMQSDPILIYSSPQEPSCPATPPLASDQSKLPQQVEILTQATQGRCIELAVQLAQ